MADASTVSAPAPRVKAPPPPDCLLIALGLGGVAVLARFWGANPEYADRFLVIAAAAYLAWAARPELAMLPARPTRWGYLPLLAGAVGFPVGWFLQAQVAPKPVVLWWIAGSWVLAAAGLLLVRGGWSHLRRLAFPLVFVLFALPIPNRVLVPLQGVLQAATTNVSAKVLPLLGTPVERTGFVLSLPSGDLGVAEACSGVKSVTALTAIAAFVAHTSGFGFARGLVMLLLAVPVIAAVNAVRVVVSGLIQEHIGSDYIRGRWHEALGFGMVLLGLGLILLIAERMKRKPAEIVSAADDCLAATRSGARALPATILLAACLVATVAAQLLGRGAERELVASAPLKDVPLKLGKWDGRDVEVPEYVTAMLTQDAAIHRVYTNDLGYQASVWVIFWSSRNMVKGYHHPDVCWPNKGWKLAQREVVPADVGGCPVPLTVREFSRKNDRQLILYWTQEGRRVWTEDDERAVEAGGDSHRWLGERLFQRTPPEASGRLVVLIGTELWGNGATIRTQTVEFAKLLAAAVYDVCPWADGRVVW